MRHWRLFTGIITSFAVVLLLAGCRQESDTPAGPTVRAPSGPINLARKVNKGDPEVLAMMNEANENLAAMGLNIAVEAIDFFTIGNGRPGNRIHQQPFRWVPNDPNRIAQGDDITYIVDQSGGATFSGLTNAQTEAAIDAAFATWDAERALKKVNVVKRSDPSTDLLLFSATGVSAFGNCIGNPVGNFFAADIVNAGYFDPNCFGPNTLAFSVTFIFTSGGVPTDINGDNYLDTALNEVYWNDKWGNPCFDTGTLNPWTVGGMALPSIDVETVGFHELGHSLEIGHFGAPPIAVMNPVYAGVRIAPFPSDHAGMAAVWGSWPNP